MSDLQSRLNQLSPEKRQLLLQKLTPPKSPPPADHNGHLPHLTPAERTTPAPLSFAQQRLWFLDQLEGQSAHYNECSAQLLEGVVNIPALEHALQTIVARHDILRTTFELQDDQPVQKVHPAGQFSLLQSDLSHLPAADQHPQLQALILKEAQHPFDLAHGPLFHCHLVHLAPQKYLLLTNMHHIICDNWSTSVFVRELLTLYTNFCQNLPSPLPPLPVQYGDYAHWQHQQSHSESWQKSLAYWQKELQNAPAVLDLPTDFPRPAGQTFHGDSYHFTLPLPLLQTLKELGQQQGCTLFMTLLASYALLLGRYSRQPEVVIGSPVANRTPSETEQLIGLFLNTLPWRIFLPADLTFTELLQQVRQTTLNGLAHQHVPFEQIVERVQPQRNLSHSPIFQVLFVLHNAPKTEVNLPNLRLTPQIVPQTVAKFDLNFLAEERPDGLHLALDYSTNLFAPATIERLAQHWQLVLEQMVAHPTRPVWHFPLLTPAEQQLFEQWNHTTRPYDLSHPLHHLFEQQVRQTPHAIALQMESQTLTYAALNGRANQLAHALRQRGVGPEVMVGVCLERSLEMVIALYAILKAGGAYVPLDPTYPADRLSFMVRDASTPVLLTQAKWLPLLQGIPTQLLALDRDWDELTAGQPTTNPEIALVPENLAYLIYTSGSTGQPKGAMNSHKGIVNRLLWMQEAFQLTPADVVLQKTPFSFDVSVWEFFWPLFTGAKLVLTPPEGHKDPLLLAELIQQTGVTTLHFVPSMLQAFLAEPAAAACLSLTRVICSGEALPYELQERFFAQFSAELHNLYGPTEAAVDVTWWPCQPRDPRRFVPIGRPIANTTIHILDEHLQPVPLGVAGELHIGGVQVGRGYHDRPELTYHRFIADPFSQEPEAHLYKTGDLARYRPDGAIEYLGRIDFQVKLRGFRIELGEIETALAQFPAVREAVCLVRQDQAHDQRLVAYLTLHSGQTFDPAGLHTFLRQQLPEHMLPNHFMVLEQLPLSPNGKLDRQQLPAPDLSHTAVYVAPRTPLEETLVLVWQELLKRAEIGVEDNFFTLGGHSLLATQLVSRLRPLFGPLPVRTLFEHPTIAQLAPHLSQQIARTPSFPALQASPRPGRLPLSYAQQRLWLLHQFAGQQAAYNIPVTLRLTGGIRLDWLEQSLQTLVDRHESLRTTFGVENGQPYQNIHPTAAVPLELRDLQHLPEPLREEQARKWVEEEVQRPFDLTNGPLWRVLLLHLAPGETICALTMHHIVTDGWSMGILVRELTQLYQAHQQNQPAVLPPLPVQYADFALWQRQYVTDEALAEQLAYWEQNLAQAPAVLELPTDRPRPTIQTSHGRLAYFSLPAGLTRQLKQLGQSQGATLYMTLLAGFVTLLHRYSSQDDLVVGSGIAGRNQAEMEGVVGFFVNTLALRFNCATQPTFIELLKRVQQTTLNAYAHQDVPFEKLVERLQPERNLSHTPLFQHMFALQNMPVDELTLPDVHITPYALTHSSAKFDLTVLVEEKPAGLVGSVEYNRDLFDETTIHRLLHHYEQLLTAVVAHPHTPITKVNLLTSLERQQLLTEWNNTGRIYPRQSTIPELFSAQAAAHPHHLAAIFGEKQFTYQQLNDQANQLAHYLGQFNLAPGQLVGVFLERSAQLWVTLLAILKANCAFMPLDPTYPAERLTLMLEDGQVPLLLTHSHLQAQLPPYTGQTIYLDQLESELQTQPTHNPAGRVTPLSPAYVMYTSGSTGKPKGIVVPHRAIVRLVVNTNYVALTPADRVAQVSNIAFDASTFEIWGAWLNGATLVGIPKELLLTPAALADFVPTQGITTMFITTAWFNQLAQERPGLLAQLRYLLFGGEAVDPRWVRQVLEQGKPDHLLHVYGPTENTTYSSFYEVTHLPAAAHTVPIGRPIANSKIYVLSPHLEPVPVGVPGELYTGGDGLALGYLNRPDLTAERFVPSPFDPDERLYRTGDKVRLLPDGNIEFLGRFDNQVKIRGFRIECGEIETALRHCTAVQDCLVLVDQIEAEKRLVAYVVPAGGQEPAHWLHQLREELHRTLPDYMIPSIFISLPAFPLNPNGKVDRRALPRPEEAQILLEESYTPPRNSLETMIATIWSELLHQEKVSITANFFEIGGHSLLATQVMARLREQLPYTLPLNIIFESPTIAELAERIETIQWLQTQEQNPEELEEEQGFI